MLLLDIRLLLSRCLFSVQGSAQRRLDCKHYAERNAMGCAQGGELLFQRAQPGFSGR